MIFKRILNYIITKFKFYNCKIESTMVAINAKLEDHVCVSEQCTIYKTTSIGRYTYMQYGCEINNAEIGRFCSLGRNIIIGPWNHPLSNLSTSPKLYRKILGGNNHIYDDTPKRTIIGNDVWIGSGVIIMGGVTIGDGAVIGAGSIVTKNVPEYAIVVGNPARILRYRFEKEKIDNLLEMKWWNWEDNEIRNNIDVF